MLAFIERGSVVYFDLGALSHTSPVVVCAAAKDCLDLFDAHGRGTLHAQSQRFLSESWHGLHGSRQCPDESDPGLRRFVIRLAEGESVLDIYESEPVAALPFVRWLASMRHALWTSN